MLLPFREASVDHAIDRANRDCEALGLESEIIELGEPCWPTIRCFLKKDGRVVSYGGGKGEALAATASALYEALEHYWADQLPACLPESMLAEIAVTELAADDRLGGDAVTRRLATVSPETRVHVAQFSSNAHEPTPGERFLPYPLFRFVPQVGEDSIGDDVSVYRSFARYMSSIGTASGASASEAAVHGMLEAIEHDSVSLWLLHWFSETQPQARLVSHEDLDRVGLRGLLESVERTVSTPVLVFDVSTDLGVPSYFAVPESCDYAISTSGAGASLGPRHALSRALSELAQDHLLRSLGGQESHDECDELLAHISRWPKLQACSKFEVSKLLARADHAVAPLPAESAEPRLFDPQVALPELTCRLSLHGLQASFLKITPPESGVTVIVTAIPGLEAFSMVRGGIPIAPTSDHRRSSFETWLGTR